MNHLRGQVEEASKYIETQTLSSPRIGIIFGSGLGSVAEEILSVTVISYASIPNFPRLNVEGHAGELRIGELEGWVVAAMCGRPHFYEGYSMDQVSFPVRVLREAGCDLLIVTNAAGGLNPSFRVGDLMLIEDHINLPGMVGFNPLVGSSDKQNGMPFVSMGRAYDPDLLEFASAAAGQSGFGLRKGTYAMVCGPSYETPSELRLLRAVGADAVGMSTAPEVVVARHCGMRVLGISCITNLATGADHTEVGHHDVLAQSRLVVPMLSSLIRGVLRLLPRSA